MKICIVKKESGRIYRSADIIHFIGSEYGFKGLSLSHDPLGAPQLVYEASDAAAEDDPDGMLPRFVSITDTKHYWAAAMASGPVGIDMEEKTRKVRPAAAKALHPLEQQYLAGLSEESAEWNREFLDIWTRKEAFMKLSPGALREGPRGFSVIGEDLAYKESMTPEDAGTQMGDTEERCPSAVFTSVNAFPAVTMTVCCTSDRLTETLLVPYGGTHELTALEKASALLAEKAYTQREMREKLISKGYQAKEAAEAAATLAERGYIDDAQYAADYISRAQDAGKGRLRIRKELALRGIPDEVISCDRDKESELERALKAAGRLTEGRQFDERLKAKVARKLSALGYEASVIWAVLEKIENK